MCVGGLQDEERGLQDVLAAVLPLGFRGLHEGTGCEELRVAAGVDEGVETPQLRHGCVAGRPDAFATRVRQ